MYEGNIAEFGLHLMEFSEWEVNPKDTTILGISLESTCSMPLQEATELMRIRKKGRFLSFPKKVGGAEARELLAHLAGSLARSEGSDLNENLRRAANTLKSTDSPAKLLLFAKVLETAILHSEKHEVWRGALNTFASVLKNDSRKSGHIATYILKNICKNPRAGARKKELSEMLLVKAAFVADSSLARVAIPAMETISGPLGLAALIALSSNGALPRELHAFASNLIHGIGEAIEGRGAGGPAAMRLAFKGEMLTESLAQQGAFEGFRCILNGRVNLPHPLFLAEVGASGHPVPTLERGGVHDSSFSALSRIRSWWAVSALFSGIAQLISPHIELPPRQVIGERPILRALPRIGGYLSSALALSGAKGADEFSNLILGPDFGEISRVCPLQAREMGPCACALLEEASLAGLLGFALPTRAAGLINRGMQARLKEGASQERAARVGAANLLWIVRQYEVLAGKGTIVDKDKMMRFLAKVSRGELKNRSSISRLPPKRIK